jgi:beta-N-acetylhexosaminidase
MIRIMVVPMRRFFCAGLFVVCVLALTAQSGRRGRGGVSQNAALRDRAARIVSGMDRKTLAAQVFLTAVAGRSMNEETRRLLAETPAGGIMLFGYNVSAGPEGSRRFIEELSATVAAVSVAPFIAADQEGGAVQRFRGAAALPPPLSYWEALEKRETGGGPGGTGGSSGGARREALTALEKEAALAAGELRRMGVTFNLAPVAEPLTEGNRPFLKDRSYGPDGDFTADAAAAFVRAMDSAGVASAVKHFPGNSGADPHRSRSALDLSETELERLIRPFRSVLGRTEPAAVMVSHVIVPAWDSRPSSLSPRAVKRLRDLGFGGIILADDFAMAAAGAPPEVCAVEALAAGVDMIMAWPGDLRGLHRAVLAALDKGGLTEARLREAAERIVYQKIRYGLIR